MCSGEAAGWFSVAARLLAAARKLRGARLIVDALARASPLAAPDFTQAAPAHFVGSKQFVGATNLAMHVSRA